MIRGASIRSQRISRRATNSRRVPGLNLVSLMDIFTILVFFLMVNSAQVEVLPNAKAMTLPDSVSTEKPSEHILLTLSREDLQINGRVVMRLDEAANSSGAIIEPLKTVLLTTPLQAVEGGTPGQVSRGEVNIMADKDTPFQLIRRVMATCTDANFSRISLAVITQSPGASE
ncbi:ExbD/TolR family protein [Polycyclovorans algicola]|uniref:ExbD/TolR family protein n=1 Tax=Polycyclovorans algicola TaxID=616992 RepID=UPI0004A7107F|nr:biopolymer transporter ExbD [Polycyclovorans algicola]